MNAIAPNAEERAKRSEGNDQLYVATKTREAMNVVNGIN